jgi:hypothetical protein
VKHRAMDMTDVEPDAGDLEHYTTSDIQKISDDAETSRSASMSQMKTLDACCACLVFAFFILCGFVYCDLRT